MHTQLMYLDSVYNKILNGAGPERVCAQLLHEKVRKTGQAHWYEYSVSHRH